MARNDYTRGKRRRSKGKTHKSRNNVIFVLVILLVLVGLYFGLNSLGLFDKNEESESPTPTPIVQTPQPTVEPTLEPTAEPVATAEPTAEPSPEPEAGINVAYISTADTDGSVRVRDDASSQGEILGSIYNRELVYVLEKGDEYYRIDYEGNPGYVHGKYVEDGWPEDNMLRNIITGDIEYSKLVEVTDYRDDYIIELPFATEDNFAETKLYPFQLALLQESSAEKLAKAQELFLEDGYSIVIWDAYRPYSVSVEIYNIFQDPKLVADPSKGSKHNRGVAVDITLYDLSTNTYVDMPTESREMDSATVSRSSSKMTSEQRSNMEYMTDIMEQAGFTPYSGEWWHFNDTDWEKFPILNLQFESWQ